jgi:hypothetical protein
MVPVQRHAAAGGDEAGADGRHRAADDGEEDDRFAGPDDEYSADGDATEDPDEEPDDSDDEDSDSEEDSADEDSDDDPPPCPPGRTSTAQPAMTVIPALSDASPVRPRHVDRGALLAALADLQRADGSARE